MIYVPRFLQKKQPLDPRTHPHATHPKFTQNRPNKFWPDLRRDLIDPWHAPPSQAQRMQEVLPLLCHELNTPLPGS